MTKQVKIVEVERTCCISYVSLKKLLKNVPEEYLDSIELESQEYHIPYESTPSNILVITYERLETDAEESTREAKELADRKKYEAREREQLRVLQEKYKKTK